MMRHDQDTTSLTDDESTAVSIGPGTGDRNAYQLWGSAVGHSGVPIVRIAAGGRKACADQAARTRL